MSMKCSILGIFAFKVLTFEEDGLLGMRPLVLGLLRVRKLLNYPYALYCSLWVPDFLYVVYFRLFRRDTIGLQHSSFLSSFRNDFC